MMGASITIDEMERWNFYPSNGDNLATLVLDGLELKFKYHGDPYCVAMVIASKLGYQLTRKEPQAENAVLKMPTPPTDDLWLEFVHPQKFCGLCGNTGIVDTTSSARTHAGVGCGVRRWCICPNGRLDRLRHEASAPPPAPSAPPQSPLS